MKRMLERVYDRRSDDAGVALVVAIALIGVVGVLMMAVLAYSIREIGLSGRDRQRSVGVTTAEGTLDAAIAAIQSADPTTLPCGTSTSTSQNGPDTVTLVQTVSFFTAAGLAASPPVASTCPISAATQIVSASVKVTGTTQKLNGERPAVRTVESLMSLAPLYDNKLSKAIFAQSGITLSNNGTVYGQNGKPNADLYTNGNFNCANNQTYHGSLYVKGQVSMSGSCTVDGDVYAGSMLAGSKAAIGGNLKIVTGNVSYVGSVGGKVYYSSPNTVTWSGCGTVNSPPNPTDKCQSQVGMVVPSQSFPQILSSAYTDPGWAANGFTNVVNTSSLPAKYSTCTVSGKMNGPGQYLIDQGPNLPAGTILIVPCAQGVYVDSPSNILLKNSLAIFSQGPFTIAKVNIASTNSTSHFLYMIQPYDAVATHPCLATPTSTPSGGISLDNQVTIDVTINELLYTPCSIIKANNSTHYGQIYAGGTTTIANKLTMYYQPIPVWGVSNTPQIIGYDVSIQYKREN